MRSVRSLIAGTLVCLMLAIPSLAANAQEPPATPEGVTAAATFRETEATIGDRAVLVVRVQHPDDMVITVPLPALADVEVLNHGEATVEGQPDGSVVTEVTFRYQVFALGPIETGPVTVRWIEEDGTSGAFETAGAQVTVVSVRAPGDEALRPLKPQLSIEGAPPAWLLPAGIALGIVVLAVLIALAVRRFRRRPVEEEPEPPDVPERRARERLATVQHTVLEDEEEFQRFYGTISSAVREYLGERFDFNASALTSTELEARMTSFGVDRWQARLVSGLLDRCDRAVYAREYPDPASADHDLTVAFEIIELSRPPVSAERDEPEAVAS